MGERLLESAGLLGGAGGGMEWSCGRRSVRFTRGNVPGGSGEEGDGVDKSAGDGRSWWQGYGD